MVERQTLVEQPEVLAEQEELEDDELAPCFDLEEVGDLEVCAGGLYEDGPRVDKVLSSCTGILEACPPPQ